MRITSVQIHGFANFVEPLQWGPLRDVNVLYGPNNVGKSNLLRALALYFRLLGAGEAVTQAQMQMLDRPDEELAQLMSAGFQRPEPRPILLTVEWAITEKDLESAGLFPELPSDRVVTAFELKTINRATELRVKKWLLRDQDVSTMDRAKNAAVVGFAQQLRRLLSDACPFQFEQPVLPVATLGRVSEGFPQALKDALFDARQSVRPEQRKRWQLFARLAASVRSEVGSGGWETVFDRTTGRADLIYVRDEDTISLPEMGAGVQRLVALIGELCLAREPYVCLEEPEWRLSLDLQRRFMEHARTILQSGIGPRQLFCTTHSPFLAAHGTAFSLEIADGAPMLEQRAWSMPGLAVGANGTAPEPAADLGGLIDLVESLAELDPEEMTLDDAVDEPAPARPAPAAQRPPAPAATGKQPAAAGAKAWSGSHRR